MSKHNNNNNNNKNETPPPLSGQPLPVWCHWNKKKKNQPENPITSFILFLDRLKVIFIIVLYSLCMCVFSFHLCGSLYSQILIFLYHSEKNNNEILFVQMKNVLLLPLCEVTKGKATQSYNPTCCFWGEDFLGGLRSNVGRNKKRTDGDVQSEQELGKGELPVSHGAAEECFAFTCKWTSSTLPRWVDSMPEIWCRILGSLPEKAGFWWNFK